MWPLRGTGNFSLQRLRSDVWRNMRRSLHNALRWTLALWTSLWRFLWNLQWRSFAWKMLASVRKDFDVRAYLQRAVSWSMPTVWSKMLKAMLTFEMWSSLLGRMRSMHWRMSRTRMPQSMLKRRLQSWEELDSLPGLPIVRAQMRACPTWYRLCGAAFAR